MTRPIAKYPVVLSIGAALLTLALKGIAYRVTGSVGLLSEAVESIVNLVAALTAFVSLWYASRPIDPSHTYGHEKIEFFSSGLEGLLVLVAAAGIAVYAAERLFRPQPLAALTVGTTIALVAGVINLAVARVLLRAGRETLSVILLAEGQHLMTDVWTSLAVVTGLGLVWLTGRPRLDAIPALIVSANIAWTGGNLLRRSFNGLMDHALPLPEQERVRSAIESRLEPGMDYHALRTREAGARRFVDFHLLVPGNFTVRRAHEVIGRVEEAVQAALPGVEVYVHVEPIEDRTAWEDSELVALEQAERRARQRAPSAPPPGPAVEPESRSGG